MTAKNLVIRFAVVIAVAGSLMLVLLRFTQLDAAVVVFVTVFLGAVAGGLMDYWQRRGAP